MREYRMDIVSTLPRDSLVSWAALHTAVDRLNTTIFDISHSYDHGVVDLTSKLQDELGHSPRLPRLASRISPAPSRDACTDPYIKRARSKTPGPKLRRPPLDASRMLYDHLNTAFQRTPDLARIHVKSLQWTASGSVSVILSEPTTPDVVSFAGQRVVALHGVGAGSYCAEPFRFRSTLGFPRVRRMDADASLIDARKAARPPEGTHRQWREILARSDTKFR
ncbi:hypothetical protein C8Q78DRAFT_1082065 [Trametes maxima]|nr:hypothetical protein C8Q78DRAFT_1082065 [Trametes maxima]